MARQDPSFTFGSGVFRYRWGQIPDEPVDPAASVWLLVFYEGVEFLGFTGTQERCPPEWREWSFP